jgi:hypothetical protein
LQDTKPVTSRSRNSERSGLAIAFTAPELAFFACRAPAGTTPAELVAVAGARWAVEFAQS